MSGTLEKDLAVVVARAIKNALEHYSETIAPIIRERCEGLIREAVEPLQQRIAELEAAPRGLKYCGVWRSEEPYHVAGNVVSDKGGMYVCMADQTHLRPSESRDWQLAVRAGRDAR